MLDLARGLDVPDFPKVQVFRDDRRTAVYYVIPSAPAVAVDDNGRAECRLLIYLQRGPDGPIASGGNLSITTTLTIDDESLAAIKRSIETVLTPVPTDPDAAPPPRVVVQIASPDWLGGSVTATLAPGVMLTGTPSLFSDNRCALSGPFGADAAKTLRDRWRHGLPGARLVYDMRMRVATTAAAGVQIRDADAAVGSFGVTARTGALDVDLSATTARSQPIAIEGPLVASGLDRLITEIDLSR
jgi:hypothetical protein